MKKPLMKHLMILILELIKRRKTLIPIHENIRILHLHLNDNHAANIPATTSDSDVKCWEKLLYLESIKSNPTKTLYINPNFNSTPISTITQCLSLMGINLAATCRILDM
ncbi:mitochondrial transcription termination factorfamily protein [Striga asiatica]|uniref:Mitochondrial transcription termination factorfamily protein n=1 Tax=Striga asiatica TaxID=4170 RepID=A0A5A7REP9_STRAF|nr:mitochondrial transcription termination factorfamily protein [Striga asiatica]